MVQTIPKWVFYYCFNHITVHVLHLHGTSKDKKSRNRRRRALRARPDGPQVSDVDLSGRRKNRLVLNAGNGGNDL